MSVSRNESAYAMKYYSVRRKDKTVQCALQLHRLGECLAKGSESERKKWNIQWSHSAEFKETKKGFRYSPVQINSETWSVELVSEEVIKVGKEGTLRGGFGVEV